MKKIINKIILICIFTILSNNSSKIFGMETSEIHEQTIIEELFENFLEAFGAHPKEFLEKHRNSTKKLIQENLMPIAKDVLLFQQNQSTIARNEALSRLKEHLENLITIFVKKRMECTAEGTKEVLQNIINLTLLYENLSLNNAAPNNPIS